MKDIEIKEMDIISCYDFRLLQALRYKKIKKLSDIINCTKLIERSPENSETENVYQGLRDLALYRYCDIPCDNNAILDSPIIFDDEGYPIGIMNDDRRLSSINHCLGLGLWDDGEVRSYIRRNGYGNLENANLRMVFSDILTSKFPVYKENTKIGSMLKKRVQLILESSEKSIEDKKRK